MPVSRASIIAALVALITFSIVSLGNAQQRVQFARRPAQVGDEVEQVISVDVRFTTLLRQNNELTEKNKTRVRTAQQRVVTTTETDAGRTMGVLVRYDQATKQLTSGDAEEPSAATPQPVEGKAYRCRREPGADGKLIVTDRDGQIPPLEEYEIVAESMDVVGRPNPLMEFLAGRIVSVGETLSLPEETAKELFKLGGKFGEIGGFELTLQSLQSQRGSKCAVFLARVEAVSSDSSQMRMQVEGPLVVEVDTCRASQLALSGPIGLSETRGSYSTAHQLIGTGQLKMSIASTYRDARR